MTTKVRNKTKMRNLTQLLILMIFSAFAFSIFLLLILFFTTAKLHLGYYKYISNV